MDEAKAVERRIAEHQAFIQNAKEELTPNPPWDFESMLNRMPPLLRQEFELRVQRRVIWAEVAAKRELLQEVIDGKHDEEYYAISGERPRVVKPLPCTPSRQALAQPT